MKLALCLVFAVFFCAASAERCPNGEPIVMCFADPCQVSHCEVPGAVCRSNYCGGCFAEWYKDGDRVCN